MHGNHSIELTDSPAPGVIPGPVYVHEGTVAGDDLVPEAPTGGPAQRPNRHSRVSTPLAKLLSLMRGDKYMVDAYPPAWHSAAATRDEEPRAR
jgi:hypothetical protein